MMTVLAVVEMAMRMFAGHSSMWKMPTAGDTSCVWPRIRSEALATTAAAASPPAVSPPMICSRMAAVPESHAPAPPPPLMEVAPSSAAAASPPADGPAPAAPAAEAATAPPGEPASASCSELAIAAETRELDPSSGSSSQSITFPSSDAVTAVRPPGRPTMRRTSPRWLPSIPLDASSTTRTSEYVGTCHMRHVLSRAPLKSPVPSGRQVSVTTSPRCPSRLPISWHWMPRSSARRARHSGASVEMSQTLMPLSRPAEARRCVRSCTLSESTAALWPVMVSRSVYPRSASHTLMLQSLLPLMRLFLNANTRTSTSLSWAGNSADTLASERITLVGRPARSDHTKMPSAPPETSTSGSVGWNTSARTGESCPLSTRATCIAPAGEESGCKMKMLWLPDT
mmetsp:Transcript_543/g.2154  ORF Transcript_543/g.2154 Transcript_543/m.2154 type:complete len:398 (-) Transcript_543:383-1576(-)